MPRYDFRCPHGHVTELVCSMADVPATTTCTGSISNVALMSAPAGDPIFDDVGPTERPGLDAYECCATAERLFSAPAAIHFKGSGFYATDVKGRVERRRRKGNADLMPAIHDPSAAAIARHI